MTELEKITGKKIGEVAVVKPSLYLLTNGIGHEAVEYAESVKEPEKLYVVYDQNVPAGLPEESRIFREILKFAEDHGASFKQAKGIAEKWLLEEGKINRGDIVVSGTGHPSVVGSVGAVGISLSAIELARVLEKGEYQFIVPESVYVEVKGKASEELGMIDASLFLLKQLGDVKGKCLCFTGKDLSKHEREVLCTMAVDTGAFTAMFVEEGKAEKTVDLSKVPSMLRMPCKEKSEQKEANISTLEEIQGKKIHAGQIGGLQGGDIEDLRKLAKIIEGKKLKTGFRLSICPSSSKVYLDALNEGLITKFLDYHAQINAAGDHDIVPQGAGVIGHGERFMTTGLYTFSGAMGCEDAEIYTASVESIARASFAD